MLRGKARPIGRAFFLGVARRARRIECFRQSGGVPWGKAAVDPVSRRSWAPVRRLPGSRPRHCKPRAGLGFRTVL